MVLQSYFTEYEIELIQNALEAQSTKWKAIANRPVQGYGTANELAKKDKAQTKAKEIYDLLYKIMEYTI
jgi:hypothetical protein